jgi:PGF-pre-PGF domain-containing protein/surface glycoprotein (TIGR04207 family)
MTERTEQVRAIFLTVLMVCSVVATSGIAFSTTAAAEGTAGDAPSVDLNDQEFNPATDTTLEIAYNATGEMDTDDIAVAVSNDSKDLLAVNTSLTASEGVATVTIGANNLTGDTELTVKLENKTSAAEVASDTATLTASSLSATNAAITDPNDDGVIKDGDSVNVSVEVEETTENSTITAEVGKLGAADDTITLTKSADKDGGVEVYASNFTADRTRAGNDGTYRVTVTAADDQNTVQTETGPVELDLWAPDESQILNATKNVDIWERSILPLRAETDSAAYTLDNADWRVSEDSLGTEPLSKKDPIGVYSTGSDIAVTFDSLRASTDLGYSDDQLDTKLIAARLEGDDSLNSLTNIENVRDILTAENINTNATSQVVGSAQINDSGEAAFTFSPDEPGQYALVLLSNESGSLAVDDAGNLSANGQTTVLGVDQAMVQRGNTTVSPDGSGPYIAGENITFTANTSSVIQTQSGENVTHSIAVYDEATFDNAKFTIDVQKPFGLSNISDSLTLEHSIAQVNGVWTVREDVTLSGLAFSQTRASGKTNLSEVVDFAANESGTGDITTTTDGSTVWNSSMAVSTTDGPNGTVVIETEQSWPADDYRFVHLASNENGSEVASNAGTLTVKQPSEQIIESSIVDREITTGENATVEVTVQAPSDQDISPTLTLSVGNGTTLAEQTVAVSADERRVVSLSSAFGTTGTRTLQINNNVVGDVNVVSPTKRSFTLSKGTVAVDEPFTLTVNVTNNQSTEADISVDPTGLPTSATDTKTVTVPAESSQLVEFTSSYSSRPDGGQQDISLATVSQTETLTITRKDVTLSVSPYLPAQPVPGDTVTFEIARSDEKIADAVDLTFERVDADVDVLDNTSVGPSIDRSFSEAGTYKVTAEKSQTNNINFISDTAQFDINSPADLTLSDASTAFTEVTASQDVEALVTVENTGDVSGTRTVQLVATDTDPNEVIATREVSVSGSSTQDVILSGAIQPDGNTAPENRSLAVQELDADSNVVKELSIGNVTVISALRVSDVTVGQLIVSEGDSVDINVTMTNFGTAALKSPLDTQNITVTLDGTSKPAAEFSPPAGEDEKQTFTFSDLTSGSKDLTVDPEYFNGNYTLRDAVNVTAQDVYDVDLAANRTTVEAGDQIAFNVTSPGTPVDVPSPSGDLEATLDVERISDGEVVATSQTVDGKTTLGITEPGQYVVSTSDHVQSLSSSAIADPGSLEIQVQEPGDLRVTSASVTTPEVAKTANATVSAVVTNDGETQATETIKLVNRDNAGASKSVTLAGGGRKRVNLTTSFSTTGVRSLNVTTDDPDEGLVNAGQVEVTEPLRITDITPDTRFAKVDDNVGIDVEITNEGTTTVSADETQRNVTVSIGSSDPDVPSETVTKSAFDGNTEFTAGESHTLTFTPDTLNPAAQAGSRTVSVDGTDGGTISVTRESVGLSLAVPVEQTVDSDVTFTVTRTDTDETVDATIQFPDRQSLSTGSDGTVTTSFESPFSGTVEAVKQNTRTTVFRSDSQSLSVVEPADLVVSSASINQTRLFAGQAVAVDVTVINVGGSAGSTTINVVNETTPSNALDSAETSTLSAGERETITLEPELTKTGQQTLLVENETAGTVTVDDAVAITDISVPSAVKATDQNFTVDVTVTDRVTDSQDGTVPVTVTADGTSTDRTVTVGDGTEVTDRFNFSTGDAGESATVAVNGITIGDVEFAEDTVGLSLSTTPDPANITAGNQITFDVERTDDDTAVDATIDVAGQTLRTGDDGSVGTSLPVAGVFTASATKAGTSTTAFTRDTATVNVTDPLDVSLSSEFGTVQASPVRGGDRPAAASQTRTITITNTGGRTVSLGGFGFSGAGADQFRITSDIPASIAPDGSADVDVAFRPTIRDNVSTEFKFRADTPSDSVRTLSLSGTGEAGEVTASTTSLGFGSTLTEKDVTITNDGNTALTVSPQSASLEDAFSVSKGEQTIQPGNSETYTVEFDPSSSELPGRFTDVLEFETDDPFDETLSVSLNGTISQGELDVSPQSFDLGDVAVGNTESVSVVVGNTGTKTIENITARHASTPELDFVSPSADEDILGGDVLRPGQERLVDIQVTQDSDADASSVTLDLEPSGDASTQSVDISATPRAPDLSLTPTVDQKDTPDELTYNPTPLGSTAVSELTVTNTGDGQLQLTNLSIDGPATTPYSLGGSSTARTLEPNEATTVAVRFNPVTTGTFEESALTFDWNDPTVDGTSSVRANLNGSGIETNLTANTSSVTFETIGAGATTNESIALRNDGNAELNIRSVTLTGDTDQFSVDTNAVADTLGAGEATTIPLGYGPSTAEDHSAEIAITAKTPSGFTTFSATLEGTATPPVAQVSDRTLTFGFVNNQSSSTTIAETTVSNDGRPGTSLNASASLSSSTPEAFTITEEPSSSGGSVKVEFAPRESDSGKLTGTLAIRTDDPDNPVVNVSLIGFATAPDATVNRSQVTFGDVQLDSTSQTEAIEVTNEGGVPVTITDTKLDSTTHFELVSGTETTLVPGETTAVTVRARPTAVNSQSTDLTVETNRTNDVSPISLSANGIKPTVTVDSDASGDFADTRTSSSRTQSLTVRNTGEATLVLDNISASNEAFSVVSGPSTVRLGANESETLTIAFNPTTTGTFDGSLSIETNDGTTETITRSLSGTGTQADTSLSESAVGFGSVAIETTESRQLTLTNTGEADLEITGSSISGADASAFSVSGLGATTIAAEDSESFNVGVSPTLAKSLTAQLRIKTAQGQSASDINVTLGATGVEPNLEVSRTQVTFDRTRLGTSSTETIQLNNTGNAPLNIRDVLLASSTDQFSVRADSEVIPAKDSRTVTVRFSPPPSDVQAAKDGTERTATLTVRSNDTDQSAVDITVAGQSKTPELDVENTVRFGTLNIGQTTTKTVTISNEPDATAGIELSELTIIGSDAGEFSLAPLSDTTLSPGDEATATVDLTPESGGIKTASLFLATNDPRQPRDSVSLSNSRTIVIVTYGSVTFSYTGVSDTDPKFKSANDPSTGVIGIDPVLTTTTDFEMSFEKRSAAAGPEVDNTDPVAPIRYLDVSSSLSSSQHDQTTVQFRVDKSKVDSLNSTRDNIGLYQYNGSSYEPKQTTRLPSEDTATQYAYEAPIDSFNATLIGVEQAALNLTDSSVSDVPDSLDDGESDNVTVTVTLENTGNLSGSTTINITGTGSTTTKTATVGANTQKSVDLSVPITGPGDRTLTISAAGSQITETFTVSEPDSGGGGGPPVYNPPDDDTGDGTDDDTGDGTDDDTGDGTDDDTGDGTDDDTGDGPEINVAPSSLDFGEQFVNTQATEQITISNDGSEPLSVDSLSLSGDTGQFSVGTKSLAVAPNESQTVAVKFIPTIADSASATLSIETPSESVGVNLTGTGVESDVSVAPLSYDFGSMTVGNQTEAEFTIQNTGDGVAQLGKVRLAGSSASAFELSQQLSETELAAGASQNVTVAFSPERAGSYSARLEVTNASGVVVGESSLTGTGDAPRIRVQPSSLSFTNATVNETSQRSFSVANRGNATLTVTELQFAGPRRGFSVDASTPLTLAPGESREIAVTFTPRTPAVRSVNLLVQSDDPQNARTQVFLTNTRADLDVTSTRDANETQVNARVNNAEAGVPVPVSVLEGEASNENRVSVDEVSITPNQGGNFTANISTPRTLPDGAPEFDTETGTEALDYVDVNTSISNDNISQAQFTFRVNKSTLEARQSEPEDIKMYRAGENGWETRPTEFTNETNSEYVFQTNTSELSAWTVGAEQPQISVDSAETNLTTATVGQTVNIRVSLVNTGGSDGTYTTELLINESVVESESTTVPPNGSRLVTFERGFDEPGTYSVQVNDVFVGSVTINADDDDVNVTTPTPTTPTTPDETDTATSPGETDTTTSDDGDGGSPILPLVIIVVVVIAIAAVALWMREQ